jgi:hypothetical protein
VERRIKKTYGKWNSIKIVKFFGSSKKLRKLIEKQAWNDVTTRE